MRSHSLSTSLRYATNWFIATVFTLSLGGCALRGTEQGPMPSLAPLDPAPELPLDSEAGQPSYVTVADAYQLVATSAPARAIASDALAGGERNFKKLFGAAPLAIGVIVLDTSDVNERRQVPSPASGENLTTIALVTAGMNDTSAIAAHAALAKSVRFMAAHAWTRDFAAVWLETLETNDFFASSGGGVTPGLPDWMRFAVVSSIADSASVQRSRAYLALRSEDLLSLEELFGIELIDDERRDATDRLRSQDSGVATDDAMDIYLAEATSVLGYLRETQGSDAVAELFGELTAGVPIGEALASLPTPLTVTHLDTAWRGWISGSVTAGRLAK